MLWLRYTLPHVDAYRAEIVRSIEKASGMSIAVESIQGGWGGLRPVLRLEGVRIADRQGKAAFALEAAEVSLSWWSLFRGEVRFHDVDFHRPHLVLTRGADGLIYLADKPLNEAGPEGDGAFTEWLLAQPRLGIHEATLTWRDDFAGAPEVQLTSVAIAVRRTLGGRHRFALTALPPRDLARRLDLRADLALRREGQRWVASGEAYAETLDADLARLRVHLPVPETLRSGLGSLRVWARFFGAEGVRDMVADLVLRDARAQLAADTLPLEMAELSGRATYRALANGFSFATEGLRFRPAATTETQAGDFTLTRSADPGQPPRMEVRAGRIDLKIAAALIDYFPVPREVKSQVQAFAPRGRVADATVAWTEDGATRYSVKGRFEDLAVNAFENLPGVSGLTGTVEGTEAGGRLQLASRGVRFELASFFEQPLALETLEADVRWKREGDVLHVAVEDARFANPDAQGRVAGTWRSLPGSRVRSPGYIDIKGTFSNARADRVAAYLPHGIRPAREWVRQSVLAGDIPRASFEVKGDLWHFPFGPGAGEQGRFLFEGDLAQARLRYHPEWPSVDRIDGAFRFENRSMRIAARSAAIFASRVRATTAAIADMGAAVPQLVVEGEVDTTAADGVRFLRESPLAGGPGAFTRTVALDGPGRLKLRLDYPLTGLDPARVAGEYSFDGATASVSKDLALRELRGRLTFTERGIRAPELTGVMFARPATLALASQPDGQVLATLAGRIDARSLAPHIPPFLAERLQGEAAWQAQVLAGANAPTVQVSSDLRGLAVSLPEPLGKAADAARPLAVAVARPGAEGEAMTATLQGGVYGRFNRGAGGRWQAALKMGAPFAAEPVREGLWLHGAVPALDVDAWLAVFATPRAAAGTAPDAAQAAIALRGLDLRLGRLRYLGREFRDLAARLEREDGQWSGMLESPLIAGQVRWDPQGRGAFLARLDRLAIPEPAQPAPQEPPPEGSQELPAIDVESARFDFRGRTLGRLALKARPADDEWRIERLDIEAGHARLRSQGVFRRTGAGPLTTLDLRLDAENLNALFAQFGYGDYLKRGNGQLEGTLVWPGYPHDFATANASGTFKVEARNGQFARIEPGAGKLLGLLSLQSLPRRATFDFRDVFSEGFAFERIRGDVRMARGVLLTEDFEIGGASAFVSLAGEVSLPQETQSLTLRVVPEVGEGMALAATVFGTPVLGLSTLLVSKLLNNPLGKVVAYEYRVTGSWDNPLVQRTSDAPRGAGPPARAATAPADANR